MAISVRQLVVLLLSILVIGITIFLFTSDNARFPITPLSTDLPSDSVTSKPRNKTVLSVGAPGTSSLRNDNETIPSGEAKLPSPSISDDHPANPTSPIPRNDGVSSGGAPETSTHNDKGSIIDVDMRWALCRGPGSADYIPCLDNYVAIKQLKSRKHMEHRERHCPDPGSRCLVPLPDGYKPPVRWPKSRDMIWYDNVPHPGLVEYKKDQNWVRKSSDYLVFPGGGTQFKFGVTHYVEFIEKTLPLIEWGKHTRVVLDVGCGVASFGGYLLDKDVITMSFAPKDEHEAQIQFALERGIPATLSVIGTQRLTFPSNSYDLIHCARCRVHWDGDGGKPLLELNRILRPGGLFIWSATPVYRDDERDRNVWNAMVSLTKSICWKVLTKTVDSTGVGLIIYQKPTSDECYKKRSTEDPPLCDRKDELITPWYAPLTRCISRLPVDETGNLLSWPEPWPKRLVGRPSSIISGDDEENFYRDTKHWSALVSDIYMDGLGLNWSNVRNVMDMNAGYGGFAAALMDQPLWVMNVVPVNAPDSLSIIFDRGLIGMYHDWCESFNTYPRTYDLLHSSFLIGNLTRRCDIIEVTAEMDRILRPGGNLVVQDTMEAIEKLEPVLISLHWSTKIHQDRFLVGTKGFWRP